MPSDVTSTSQRNCSGVGSELDIDQFYRFGVANAAFCAGIRQGGAPVYGAYRDGIYQSIPFGDRPGKEDHPAGPGAERPLPDRELD